MTTARWIAVVLVVAVVSGFGFTTGLRSDDRRRPVPPIELDRPDVPSPGPPTSRLDLIPTIVLPPILPPPELVVTTLSEATTSRTPATQPPATQPIPDPAPVSSQTPQSAPVVDGHVDDDDDDNVDEEDDDVDDGGEIDDD